MDMDISIYGYGYIHGYPRKICGYGYGYGWEISYPVHGNPESRSMRGVRIMSARYADRQRRGNNGKRIPSIISY